MLCRGFFLVSSDCPGSGLQRGFLPTGDKDCWGVMCALILPWAGVRVQLGMTAVENTTKPPSPSVRAVWGDLPFGQLWCGLLHLSSPLYFGIRSCTAYHWTLTHAPGKKPKKQTRRGICKGKEDREVVLWQINSYLYPFDHKNLSYTWSMHSQLMDHISKYETLQELLTGH